MSTLLTMYSSANSVYPIRRKAGKEAPGVINQPNLVVFGTAIPNHYYEALSERMLTNGLFARMLIRLRTPTVDRESFDRVMEKLADQLPARRTTGRTAGRTRSRAAARKRG
jgi:hypothetical protein